jgi:hypothetical protein
MITEVILRHLSDRSEVWVCYPISGESVCFESRVFVGSAEDAIRINKRILRVVR